MLVLFASMIQRSLPLLTIKPLGGTYTLHDDTALTWQGWFSGKYQAHRDDYLTDHFELRNLFIRCRNQVDYSLFNKPDAGDIVIGKKGELYNTWYIDSYNGGNFIGTRSINDKLRKLKLIQEKLAEMHKTLLVVFAPSKDLYNPQNLPEGTLKSDSNNHDVFIKLAKQKDLNFIDFGTYFAEQKDKTPYPLFGKHGAHWSYYGACLGADSIISMMEKLRDIKMPHTIWRTNIISEEEDKDELELESELNLIFPLKHDKMGHPQIQDTSNAHQKRPTVMVIGDSYIWNLTSHYNFWNCFSSFKFSYYYNTLYTPGKGETMKSDTFNLTEAFKASDIVVVEGTESSLNHFGFGFIDAAFKTLSNDTISDIEFSKKVKSMRNTIKVQPIWMKAITEKARSGNISVDSMLTRDAIWMVEHDIN